MMRLRAAKSWCSTFPIASLKFGSFCARSFLMTKSIQRISPSQYSYLLLQLALFMDAVAIFSRRFSYLLRISLRAFSVPS